MPTVEDRVSKLEDRQLNIETRLAVAESSIKDIKEDISSIKNNTTWLLRLVLGAIVLGLGFVAFLIVFHTIDGIKEKKIKKSREG